jgi:hypothetical protein
MIYSLSQKDEVLLWALGIGHWAWAKRASGIEGIPHFFENRYNSEKFLEQLAIALRPKKPGFLRNL